MVRPLLFCRLVKQLITIAVVAAVTSRTALAQPSATNTEPVPAAATATVSDWYGAQILLSDGAAFGAAIATKHGEIAFAWVGTGAVVHAAHDHYGRAVASGGLRVGLPLAGLFLGAASSRGCTGDLCDLGPALAGGLIGMGTAEVVDLVMASDEREVAPSAPAKGWTPVASVRHSGATFGIAARF
jgi:hypothetical protein